jgi:serine/threonine protein kinase
MTRSMKHDGAQLASVKENGPADNGVPGPLRPVHLRSLERSTDTDGDGLGLDVDAALAEMAEEFSLRTLGGETVDVDQLVAAHPEQADAFQKILPILRELAQSEPTDISGGSANETDKLGPTQGKVFADFHIIREIGRGGMGVVYEALQAALRRTVALKILPLAAAMDPKARQRFQLEAQVAGLLQHPHIVPVHAVGSVGEVPYFAMQYIEGGSLAWLITELRGLAERGGDHTVIPSSGDSPSALALGLLTGRFSPSGRESADGDRQHPVSASETDKPGPQAPPSIRGRAYLRTVARLGIQAAEALDHAHDQGIVHRDVKPANLLLDRHGDLWVADFGMADVQGDAGLTLTGDLPGTLRYMSPEQAAGKRAMVDRRTDIYSLGATVYELLTLQPAIVGSDRAEIIRRIAEAEPEPIRRLNPAVPVDLATIVSKALSKEPAKRYETALQLADDLGRFLEGRPIAARPVGPVARSWRWCRRKPVQASLAAGLVLALFVGFAGITWNWWKAQAAEQRALIQAAHAAAAANDAQIQAANAAAAEKDARAQSAKADAINRFLIDKLLLQAAPEHNPGARDISLRAAIDRVSGEVGSTFREQPRIEAAIRLALGQTYHELGEYAQSEAHLHAAHDILLREPGDSGLDRLRAMIEEGHILDHLGRLEESERFLTQAEEESRRTLGVSHDLSLLAGRYLATLMKNQDKVEQAESLLRRLLDDTRRLRGPMHTEALQTMNDLAVLLQKRKRYAESEPIFRECLRLKRETQGPEHPDTLTTMSNLGSVLNELDRGDEAEAILLKCTEIRRRVLGQEHPATLRTLRILGDSLRKRGRLDEAESFLRTCLEAQRRILGPAHRDTNITQHVIDAVALDRSRDHQARKP